MIMADKIIRQRKKCGLSQEELADKLGVSRQAVSKWEGAQSTPDLGRVLEMCRLFGVSTDYLIKDELEEEEDSSGEADSGPALRRVSMEEAGGYLSLKETQAGRIALGVFLCILSPICLLVLGAGADTGVLPITENLAAGVGLVTLILLVAGAVALFISCGSREEPYEYLEKEVFETEYGVAGMVKERQNQFRERYNRSNVIGTCLCVLSPVPMFATIAATESDFIITLTVSLLLLIAGIGVSFFVTVGVRWESMQKLLQEGDYTSAAKRRSPVIGAIKTVFWLVAVALFLGYSFITDDWQRSWIVWPVAGVLYAALSVICGAVESK